MVVLTLISLFLKATTTLFYIYVESEKRKENDYFNQYQNSTMPVNCVNLQKHHTSLFTLLVFILLYSLFFHVCLVHKHMHKVDL